MRAIYLRLQYVLHDCIELGQEMCFRYLPTRKGKLWFWEMWFWEMLCKRSDLTHGVTIQSLGICTILGYCSPPAPCPHSSSMTCEVCPTFASTTISRTEL